ncbi:MAG: hypothetical protein LBM78_00705 [Clostridiales bacterium]|jgi:uncharacterized membrane protein YesL|nr:hypothetical protein [Clostridiales bacterium]
MAKKQGWIERMVVGKADRPDFTVDKLPGSRWGAFWDVLKTQTRKLIGINLLSALFCLPAVIWLFFTGLAKTNGLGSYAPFTANLGLGFPLTTTAQLEYNLAAFGMDIFSFAIFIPLLVIACIGLSGAFHSIKLLAWGENATVIGTFFRGVKSNIVPFSLSGLVLGLGYYLVVLNMDSFPLVEGRAVLMTISMVATIILFVFLLFMALFMFTQAVTYKMKFFPLLKNSFLFSVGMLLQNIFFVGITALPIVLMLLFKGIFLMLFGMLYLFIGIAVTVLVWTLYGQWVFDKFINDKVEGAIKDRGIYRKHKAEEEKKKREAEELAKRNAARRYSNPKKTKKKAGGIDDTAGFQPLEPTFSRADLVRLAAEKEAMKQEAAAEAEEDADETPLRADLSEDLPDMDDGDAADKA